MVIYIIVSASCFDEEGLCAAKNLHSNCLQAQHHIRRQSTCFPYPPAHSFCSFLWSKTTMWMPDGEKGGGAVGNGQMGRWVRAWIKHTIRAFHLWIVNSWCISEYIFSFYWCSNIEAKRVSTPCLLWPNFPVAELLVQFGFAGIIQASQIYQHKTCRSCRSVHWSEITLIKFALLQRLAKDFEHFMTCMWFFEAVWSSRGLRISSLLQVNPPLMLVCR